MCTTDSSQLDVTGQWYGVVRLGPVRVYRVPLIVTDFEWGDGLLGTMLLQRLNAVLRLDEGAMDVTVGDRSHLLHLWAGCPEGELSAVSQWRPALED